MRESRFVEIPNVGLIAEEFPDSFINGVISDEELLVTFNIYIKKISGILDRPFNAKEGDLLKAFIDQCDRRAIYMGNLLKEIIMPVWKRGPESFISEISCIVAVLIELEPTGKPAKLVVNNDVKDS